jgi:hypothetical protein
VRSLNAQIEFLLRNALRQAGRLRAEDLSTFGRDDRKQHGVTEE